MLIMKPISENGKKILGTALRLLAEFLIVCASVLGVAALASSCGSLTKASIRQVNPNSKVQVTITTNNPSTIDVTPDVKLEKQK